MGTGEAHTRFWWGNQREDHLEDRGESSRSEIRGMDWTDLAQSSDKWRAPVNAVMNLRVIQNAGNFVTGCQPPLLHGVR